MRGILRATGRQAERQEVAWACARALRPRACAYWREEEGDRGVGEVVGWAAAGLHSVGLRVSLGKFSLSFNFSVLFIFI